MALAYNSGLKMLAALAFAIALSVQCSLGEIICENLNQEICAFAVSSAGKRCVLEKQLNIRSGEETYLCITSEIEAYDQLKNLIETDHCIDACGLDRKTVGISSDSFLDLSFKQKLCSPECSESCPNIYDLYFNLAAGEGAFLPALCEAQEAGRREMLDVRSSGLAAPRPVLAPAMSRN